MTLKVVLILLFIFKYRYGDLLYLFYFARLDDVELHKNLKSKMKNHSNRETIPS